jgi:hypothetical protein
VHLWKKSPDGTWVHRGYVETRLENFYSDDEGEEENPNHTHRFYVADITFPSTGSWRIRAYLPGDDVHGPGWSPGFTYLSVKDVIVGTPDAPELMRDDTPYTVHGYLKPRHWDWDDPPVRIYKWKQLADGSWDRRGYTLAPVHDYKSYSHYQAKMSFSSPGRWRVRAYHPSDYLHRGGWSAHYDYVTVTP